MNRIFLLAILVSFVLPAFSWADQDFYTDTNIEYRKGHYLLIIESVPTGADVSVNGEFVGKTPLNYLFKPRYHSVIVRVGNPRALVEVANEKARATASVADFIHRDPLDPIHIKLHLIPGK
jgi:hypothetical protein